MTTTPTRLPGRPATARPAPPRWRRSRRPLESLAYIIVAFVLGVLIWQVVIWALRPAGFILPPPLEVWHALQALVSTSPSTPGSLWAQLGATMEATAIGFALGSAAGILLGILVGEFNLVLRLVYPYLVAIQSVPKVALVPLLAVWFGFKLEAKVALIILFVFFPVLVNTLQGVVTADHDRIDLLESLSATRLQKLIRVRLPSALPMIFTGLELGVVYAFLGAVLSEMTGAQNGIGVMLSQFQTNADTEATFAVLIILAIVGFVLNVLVRTAHRRTVFWEEAASASFRVTTQ
jgi:NitT/TauT family transport system permease protein